MIMRSTRVALLVAALMGLAGPGVAADGTLITPPTPAVAVTGAATATVSNDRMQTTMRIEAEHSSATAAANEVNARMARALAKAKSVAGVETRSAGYGTHQVWEKGRPARWKVVQSLTLTGGNFTELAALVSRLQDEDGLLVSGIAFSVSPDARRQAEDALMREAIRSWQQRASTAASALGYAAWRTGRISVATNDAGPQPRFEMMRAQTAPASAAPIAVEGGTTEITVTVTGDALLEDPKKR